MKKKSSHKKSAANRVGSKAMVRLPCVVCLQREAKVSRCMCSACYKSYTAKYNSDSIGQTIIWAADRARYFMRRKPNNKVTDAGPVTQTKPEGERSRRSRGLTGWP